MQELYTITSPIMVTALDMQPVVNTQVESPKSTILEKAGEACKRLGIAVATAVALHSSPAFAQSADNQSPAATLQPTKGSGGVLTIDGKEVSFLDFYQQYNSNSGGKMEKLGQVSREEKRKYYLWESDIDKSIDLTGSQTKEQREKIGKKLNQTTERVDNKKEALNQITQVNSILDELMQNQGLKLASESQKKINQEKGSIILAALHNPTIIQGMKPETISILRTIGNSLQKGGNVAYMNDELIKNIKIAL